MEKVAESQKVHTTWSRHACFGSCQESSAALVFNSVPRKKCQSQVLQTLKCERNYSAFVFGLKIHTQTEAKKCAPKDKLGTLVTPSANITAQTRPTQQDKCVLIQRQGRTTDVCLVWKTAAASGGFQAYLHSLEWWNETKPNTTELLSCELRQHPALRLPAGASPPAAAEIALSWTQGCVGRGRGGEGRGGSAQQKS